MEIKLPEHVKYILTTLHEKGYEAYIVGGCVRDSLLGITPHDWDITTNATPDQVETLFIETYPTGKKYGTITVGYTYENGDSALEEVTTYRADGEYTDGRRPDKVTFGNSLKEDLARRDFTINALAYNEEEGLIDYFGGLKDLNDKIIRCVGSPRKRFEEDALRTVRCIRFACKLKFKIEEKTLKACSYFILVRRCLILISKERIHNEILNITKYLTCSFTSKKGIDKLLIKIYNISKSYIPIDSNGNLYLTLTKIYEGEPNLKNILKDLKFSNEEISIIFSLQDIRSQLFKLSRNENDKKEINYCMKYLLNKYDYKLIDLCISTLHRKIKNSNVEYRNLWKSILRISSRQPHKLCHLAINGDDLIRDFKLNDRPLSGSGRLIGELLNYCLDEVIKNPSLNNKKDLYKLIEEY